MGRAKPKKKGEPACKANTRGGNAEEEEVKPHRKLYVKIPTGMDMTEAKLTELFKACGDVTSVNLVTTLNHAFGFVEFATVPEAERGIEKMNGHEGMFVKFAKPQVLDAPVVAATAVLPAAEETEEVPEKAEDEETEAPAKDKAFDHECAAAAARRYPNPVESLHAIVQKSNRTASTADCIVYTIAEVEDEWETLFVGTVQLMVPAGNASYSGKPQANKKEAKKSAAEAALGEPGLHKLLPALPPKVKEQKVAKAADSEEVHKARAAQSTKKQKQLEKAELRAKKLAMRRAAKEVESGRTESTDTGDDESVEEVEDESSTEEDGEHPEESEESEESEEDDSSGDGEADEAEVARKAAIAAQKAAIKAALAAKRKAARQRGGHTAASKEKVGPSTAETKLKKMARQDIKMANAGQETSKQENFGQTKFIKP